MLALFAIATFLGAFLLFCVQPLAGRMLLPTFGGASSVWTTCMLFFQAILLAGYGLAHVMGKRSLRAQLGLYGAFVVAVIVGAPLSWSAAADPQSGSPALAVLASLATSVGLPALVVCITAPIVQRWFTQLPHAAARDPYFLYAASNAGSLLALLAYPFVVEPLLSIAAQSSTWNAGFALLGVTMLACGGIAARSQPKALATSETASVGAAPSPATLSGAFGARSRWVFLAFVPASLLLGVTTHITTNVAAVPLLWVLPLAVYLATYILAFSRVRWVASPALAVPVPYLVVLIAPLLFAQTRFAPWIAVLANIAVTGLVSLVVHRELARARPDVTRLTEYYLCLSVGGVLAGSFNALLAPALFTSGLEYPLVLALSLLAVTVAAPVTQRASGLEPSSWRRDLGVAVIFALGCLGVVSGLTITGWLAHPAARIALIGIPAVVCFGFKERPVRFAASYAAFVTTLWAVSMLSTGDVLHAERNFFGIKRVIASDDGTRHRLFHGPISHGEQQRGTAEAEARATSYYAKEGPLGDVLGDLSADSADPTARAAAQRVGVVGLGVGTIAAYASDARRVTFFELDPAIERLARDPRLFTYLRNCGAHCEVHIGDGRLLLARTSDVFDVIVMDAFTADAIPVHLLTTQAAQTYAQRLAPSGLLVFHISNKYLDLEPVIGGLAASLDAVALAKRDDERAYALVARRDTDLSTFVASGWRPISSPITWTDEHSDILEVVRW